MKMTALVCSVLLAGQMSLAGVQSFKASSTSVDNSVDVSISGTSEASTKMAQEVFNNGESFVLQSISYKSGLIVVSLEQSGETVEVSLGGSSDVSKAVWNDITEGLVRAMNSLAKSGKWVSEKTGEAFDWSGVQISASAAISKDVLKDILEGLAELGKVSYKASKTVSKETSKAVKSVSKDVSKAVKTSAKEVYLHLGDSGFVLSLAPAKSGHQASMGDFRASSKTVLWLPNDVLEALVGHGLKAETYLQD